jgi:hypothetical protein
MKKRYSLSFYLAGAVAARAGDEMSGPALMLAAFALAGSAVDASSLLAGGRFSGCSSTERDSRDACWPAPSCCTRQGWA